MSKKIIYTEGQKVGNMTFVGNDHTVNVNNRSRRLADFKCKCGKKNWKIIAKKVLIAAVCNRAAFYISYDKIFR